MSKDDSFLSLKLHLGERFDCIPISNRDLSLAEFLDNALKTLEDESRIQLPFTDDELVDPSHFRVFSDLNLSNQLDLSVKLAEQEYLNRCLETGETPLLVLVSRIFMNADEVDRDVRATKALRRSTVGSRPMELTPPTIPDRNSSLTGPVTSNEQLLYLAGRKPYSPRGNHGLPQSNSGQSFGTEDILDRLFDNSSSDDAMSLFSVASAGTDRGIVLADRRRTLGASVGRPGSAPHRAVARTASDSSASHPRHNSSDDTYLSADTISESGSDTGKIRIVRTRSPGLFVAQSAPRPDSPNSPESILTKSGSEKPIMRTHKPLRITKSLPSGSNQVSVVVEDESDTGGVSGLSDIKEGKEMSPMLPSRRNQEREMSPVQLIRPMSPEQQGTSPGVSPSGSPRMSSKKKRLASKRVVSKKAKRHTETIGGAGSSAGLTASDEGQAQAPPSTSRTHKRTIYAKSNRHMSTFFPLRVFGNIKSFTVEFEIPTADVTVEMEIRGDFTVGQIKESLWSYLREQAGLSVDDMGSLWDPENFTFTYMIGKEKYELYDEQQIFQTAKVIQSWRSDKREKGLLTVELKQMESREEKTLNMEIGAMIGIGLYQLQFANNDELDITRRKMVTVRRNALRARDSFHYSMEPDINYMVLPPHILKMYPDNKILVRVYYKLGCERREHSGSYQTIQVDMNTSADEFTSMVIPDGEAKRERYGIPADCNINNVVLKIVGQSSYIHGHWDLAQFSPIIRLVTKKNEIELALVRKLDLSLDSPREIEDWNLVDEATGLTGTHSELSALSKEHTQIFTMSTWDIQKKFRIRVVGLDNLWNLDCEVVYVEAGIYHGGELLGYAKFTSEVLSNTYPRWSQWLVFDTTIKNLPKAARLCLQVIGGNRVKDTKKKSLRGKKSIAREGKGEGTLDKPLHWVNLQILDHRSLLRQGLLRLNLWPVVADPTTGESNMSPMGSTAVNPDGNNSAVLYVELDTYAHPVAFPTGGWGDETPPTSEPSAREKSMFKEELNKAIHADPLTHLDKSQRELIWMFRSHCSTIPEALPKLLRCLNWANLDDVLEVHRLLIAWRPITMEVALELLDYHFADEKVRSLAVRRLEKLANDELQNFLLQLVQVLKFEPYHDSALARFLLSRALQSKKIGHFFYWYLRSEMDTSEFNQRFGILLEAYLRGCGEAMFQEIRNQHTAVCKIMEVASSVKKQTDKFRGASQLAKEILAKYELPKSFSPPYDPGLQMGGLKIEKCRAMDSKKQPLWLEFQSMDPTDLANRPIKVIAKHGDDLRQDMLTLQMLSLMDKMWQAQGLDLHIIPYGCISTGNDMGMIEVVQNAETVAKIQLAHGGTFSALKEEPLHDWLKKQNPTQSRFEAAVEKFMLSCAGYCVATYVLGIGDRHNDNVMVTTSGNLFHIDFGHFLGNKKFIMGVNRERAPFVLTPDFEYVMGKRNSDTFKRFEETAVKAYMIIRKNANVFINLFSMMKCTGIPELRSVEDLEYLRSVLVLNKRDKEAEEHFKGEIQKCLKLQWSTQLNWFTHNIVHRQS